MPIVHAGDVFDRWDTPTEFVNLMIEHLPRGIYAVPGQHDLPNHSYTDIGRSAYWTLCEAGTLTNLMPGVSLVAGTKMTGLVEVHGFPWGFPPEPRTRPPAGILGGSGLDRVQVAIVHRYAWAGDAGYKNAPAEACVVDVTFAAAMAGYDAVVFGDNHKMWSANTLRYGDRQSLFNHGTAIRRNADERGLVDTGSGIIGPGVLYSDGSIVRQEFMQYEIWADAPTRELAAPLGVDADKLMALLRAGGEAAVSFRDAVAHARREAAPELTAAESGILDAWLHAAGVLN